MYVVKKLLVGLLIGVLACSHDRGQHVSADAPFCAPQDCGLLSDDGLDEISGLVASRKNPGTLWIHNDSANPAELYLINTQGKRLATYRLPEAKNIDWEDIAIGPGPEPGETYVYVGDIGDNISWHNDHCLYRLVEPVYTESSSAVVDTIRHYDRLHFSYVNGAFDAETLLLDPITQDIYVLTKEMSRIQLYQLHFPPGPPFQQQAQPVVTLPFVSTDWVDRLVGGDISADGTEVLLKTYEYVLYWRREDTTMTLPTLLQLPADTLPYRVEPQGEAIGFAADGAGYYTLSEQNFGSDVHLYFYPRCSKDSTAASLFQSTPYQ